MSRYTKSEFKEKIKDDGRVEYCAQFQSSVPWDKLTPDQKNEYCTDEQVEDGCTLEDIAYSDVKQNGRVITVTVNADASNWNQNEE